MAREVYPVAVERRDTASGEEWLLTVDDEPVTGPSGVGVFNSSGAPWTPAQAFVRLLKRAVTS